MPARILVIEDNQENLDLMTYLLTAYGYDALAARDGEKGLEAARRELPELIISDLQMPSVDGYEVARRLRRDPRFAKCRLIAVTSFAMRGDRERVLEAGFDGYISKPIDPERFIGQIEEFLHAAPRPATSPSTQATPDGTPSTRLPFHTRILALDNSPTNLDLIQSSLEPFGYRVTRTTSVREAMTAVQKEPPDLILSDLHMPDADGFDFFEAIMADRALRKIPFVVISSTFWPETDLSKALSLGVSRFIQRPLDPERLLSEIEACLTNARNQKSWPQS